ncbi:MAG: hypothetical protein H0X64_01950 [Gemmatimonadaceae bacterium]|nr:hypothetical protein [Gemmatimonadaceae bacterium]
MTHISANDRVHARLVRTAAAVLILGAAACGDFLVAENPGAVEEPDVTNAAYVNLIANGPIGTFQDAVDDVWYWNSQFTDELYNRAVFSEEGQIDRRELYTDMSYISAFMYSPLQRARFMGEDAARRLVLILGDSASSDLRVARSLAYAGHAYVLLGETFCGTPINLSAPKPSDEMFADAIAKFDSAITIATAAKVRLQAMTTVNANAVAAADSVRLFALVGAGRAALNRNDKSAAIAYAQQVIAANANFLFFAYYSDNTSAQRHRVYDRLQLGSNANLLNTPFAAMATDPRVPRIVSTTARNGIPLAPSAYSTYNGAIPGAPFAAEMRARLASTLEARYIVAEAQGPVAATLTFVNERRAAGNQAAVALVGDALMAELRDQRGRDFYLDGHRLGDLRRYRQFYNVDLFPKGPYPGSTTGQAYDETITCWPLPRNEVNGNPNIP